MVHEECDKKCSKEEEHVSDSDVRVGGRSFLRRLGPRHFQILRRYIPAMIRWSTFSFICVVYACDWKVIVDYIPFYRNKFHEDED